MKKIGYEGAETFGLIVARRFTMPFANVNGVRLSYESVGDGVPLLFIHGGYGGAPTTLAPQNHAIKTILPRDKVRTILYDRRNAGLSDYTDGHYTLATLAGDALGLLDHLGVQKAIIVGTLGRRADRAGACAVASRTGDRAVPAEHRRQSRLARAAAGQDAARTRPAQQVGRRPRGVRRAQGLVADPGSEREQGPRRDRAAGKTESGAANAYPDDDLYRYSIGEIRNFEAYLGADYSSRLGELKMPVCVIHGTADRVVPYAWGEALHRAIPQSEMHPIADADHGIFLTRAPLSHCATGSACVAQGHGVTAGHSIAQRMSRYSAC